MASKVARTLKQEIDRLIEYLDREIEKLSDQHDGDTVSLEQALLAGEEISSKDVTDRLFAAIRQLHNHDLLCHVQRQLEKIRKTADKIDELSEFCC